MPGSCNACNKEFLDETEQKQHYKSEWHRYNLKRKVAGVPGVTEALFVARQSALAEERKKTDETPMLYSCGLCGKGYRSSKAHAQHLTSKSHLLRASKGVSNQDIETTIIKPLPLRVVAKPSQGSDPEESEESEWEEADPEEDDLVDEATDSLTQLKVNERTPMEEDESENDEYDEEINPSCCFMCDLEHDTIESCLVHMSKKHSFFIPDIEYLKDPKGFLTYLALKVRRDFICLYCNERCSPFSSLEGVRKHMDAKSHCKVHYGDGGDDEEGELEDFYDYSSSYVDSEGKQLVLADDLQNSVQLSTGGELIISSRGKKGVSTRILGSREFLRYYRQKPRPTSANDVAIVSALAARYRSMGIATVQTKRDVARLNVLKTMNRTGAEEMRTKIGIKNNVIRNLPKNVPH